MMLITFFLYFIVSFIYLTLVESKCEFPGLDNPDWVFWCGGEFYATYDEAVTKCLRLNPSAKFYMVKKDSITTKTTIKSTTTTTVKSTTTTTVKSTTTTTVKSTTTTTVKSTTTAPVNGTTTTPIQCTTTTPVQCTTITPVQCTTTKPVQCTTTAPVNSTTTAPVNSTTTAPVNSTTVAPIKTTTIKESLPFDIDEIRAEYLDRTNYFRRLHVNTPPVTLSKSVEEAAQKYIEYAARNFVGKLEHDKNKTYGENLAMVPINMIHDTVDLWYEEIKDYNYLKPGFSLETGHFTQVVWRNTKEIGCGIAKGNGLFSQYFFIGCKYNPPGNFGNQFTENVLRLKN